MNTYINNCYQQYKQEAVETIAKAVVAAADIESTPELANQEAETIVHDKLRQQNNKLIAEVAERDDFNARDWVDLDTDAAALIKQLTRSAVSHDLRKTIRANREVLLRAINVRNAVDTVIDNKDANSANAVATEFQLFLQNSDSHSTELCSKFHTGHASGRKQFQVFDVTDDGDYEGSDILLALEEWLTTEYENSVSNSLADNAVPA